MEVSERSFCKKRSVAESLSSKSDLWRTDKSSASMIREWRNYGDHCIRERERERERVRVWDVRRRGKKKERVRFITLWGDGEWGNGFL